MHLNKKSFIQIKITDHALARAKQRLVIKDTDVNSFLFEVKLKEIIQKARFDHCDKNDCYYVVVYNNEKYNIIGSLQNDGSILIKTIIGKD